MYTNILVTLPQKIDRSVTEKIQNKMAKMAVVIGWFT